MHTPSSASVRIAALASLGAGIIHAAVVQDHSRTWWVSGVFFALLAAFQVGWGLLALLRPPGPGSRWGRWLLVAGLAVAVGSAALWTVTRWVTGEPFGPNAGTQLPVGPAGIASTSLELVTVVGVLASHRLPSRPARGVLAAVMAAALVLAAPTAWGVAGAVAHDHAEHADTGHHDDGHDDGHDESTDDRDEPKRHRRDRSPSPDAPVRGDDEADDGHEDDGHAH